MKARRRARAMLSTPDLTLVPAQALVFASPSRAAPAARARGPLSWPVSSSFPVGTSARGHCYRSMPAVSRRELLRARSWEQRGSVLGLRKRSRIAEGVVKEAPQVGVCPGGAGDGKRCDGRV